MRERNPAIPAEVEAVVLKALAKNPKERFGSVWLFAQAFEQACLVSCSSQPGESGSSAPSHQMTPPSQALRSREQPASADPVLRPTEPAMLPGQADTPPVATVLPLTQELLTSEPAPVLQNNISVETLIEHGKALISQKRYHEALLLFECATKLAPRSSEAWEHLGYLLNKLKRYQKSLEAHKRALSLGLHEAWVWNNKGNTLYRLNRTQEALTAYEQALSLNPSFAFAWIGKGIVLDRLQRPQEALAAYEQALSLDPSSTLAWRNKALILHHFVDTFWLWSMQVGLKGAYDCIKVFSETDLTEDLKRFDIPTLIIHGDDDQIVPIADSALLSSKIVKNATLKIYPGASHGLPTTHKDQFNEDLLSFLKS